MPKILFKKLRPEAIIPEYATPGASGMDVASPVDVTIEAGETVMIKLGFAIAVPEGYELQVRPRSGLSLKTKLRLPNAPGTIDSDYRGEVKVILANLGSEPFPVRRGERIAQLVPAPVLKAEWREVKSLDDTDRGAGGFGSTGR